MQEVIEYVINNWNQVIELILAIIGVASIIAKITPTPEDDKIIDKILGVINVIALTKKGKITALPEEKVVTTKEKSNADS